MQEKIKEITFFIISIILISISFFLLSLTKINLTDLITINIFNLIEKTTNLEFILFLIMLSLIITFYFHISNILKTKKAMIIILSSWLIGIIINTLLFNLTEFFLVFFIATIGIFLFLRENEQQSSFSTGFLVSKKFVLFFSIGLLISLLLITVPNAKELEDNFTNEILKTTIGDGQDLKQLLEEPIIETIISTQEQTILSIQTLPSYQKLIQKDDIDVKQFIMNLEIMQEIISSEEYKQELSEQMSSASELSTDDLSQQLIEDLPIIKNLAKISWILYPLMGFVLSISIFGIIIQILTAIIYTIIKNINNLTEQKQNY